MRRLAIVTIVFLATITASADPATPTKATLREAEAMAMALARGDASLLEPLLDVPMIEGSVKGTPELLLLSKTKIGKIRRVRGARAILSDETTCTISVPLVGENGTLDLVMVLKNCAFGPRQVVGCRLATHRAEDGSVYARDGDFVDHPPYVDETALLRRLFEVNSSAGPLPAILALPRHSSSKSKVPGLLVIGHAGSKDIDGTSVQCRPLRDIADGLGASGLAVLRVTPRSAEFGDDAYGSEDGFLQSDVADAERALAMLASQPEVDRDALLVLGLGGGCATAVALASKDPLVHGLILLAPPAREDVALDLRRIDAAIAAGELPESDRLRMAEAARSVSDPHALESRRYQHRPAKWWKDAGAFSLPEITQAFSGHLFIAMAGRDATLQAADVEAWSVLAGRGGRTIGRQYATLDSSFSRRPVEAAENTRPAVFVAPEVLREVLSFVYSATKPANPVTAERAPRRQAPR